MLRTHITTTPGQDVALATHYSLTAVWKAVEQLRMDDREWSYTPVEVSPLAFSHVIEVRDENNELLGYL